MSEQQQRGITGRQQQQARGLRHWWRQYRRGARHTPGPLTGEGWVFVILAFLIGLAATNTGTNLLYLIFSLMIAFLLVSGFISKRTLRRLGAQRSLARHVVADQRVEVRLTVANHKFLFSSYGLQVIDRMEDKTAAGQCYFLRVPPRGKATVSYPCVFRRRGLYRFRDVVIATTYPFGFVRRSIAVAARRDVLVYPQILPWNQLALEMPRDLGERQTRRKGAGQDLYGLREQLPDEGSRWIHWKKTAQLERLMRREFEAEEKKSISLVLDNALPEPDNEEAREAFERMIVLAASVAHHFLQGEQQVELITRSGRVPPNSGPPQRHRILRALALIEPVALNGRQPLRIAPRGDTATIVFHCNGQGSACDFPRGTRILAVPLAPPQPVLVEGALTLPRPEGRQP